MTKETPQRDAVPGDRRHPSRDGLGVIALKSFGYVLVFALWFCATAVLIRAGYRHTPAFVQADPEFHVKFTAYDALGKPPDVVFLGTSRIYRQINIRLLEQKLAQEGCANAAAYNFGLSGVSVSNMRFILDWMLARESRPRLIILEQNGAVMFNMIDSNRSYLYAPYFRPRMWVLTYGKEKVMPFLGMVLNKGAFHRLLEAKRNAVFQPVLAGERGYRSVEEQFPADGAQRADFAALRNTHPDFLVDRFKPQILYGGRAKTTQKRAAIILRGIHRRDLSRIAIINAPPSRFANVAPDQIKVDGVNMPVFNAGLNELPWLIDGDYWVDEGHLNAAGADKLSTFLAPNICQELKRRNAVY